MNDFTLAIRPEDFSIEDLLDFLKTNSGNQPAIISIASTGDFVVNGLNNFWPPVTGHGSNELIKAVVDPQSCRKAS